MGLIGVPGALAGRRLFKALNRRTLEADRGLKASCLADVLLSAPSAEFFSCCGRSDEMSLEEITRSGARWSTWLAAAMPAAGPAAAAVELAQDSKEVSRWTWCSWPDESCSP